MVAKQNRYFKCKYCPSAFTTANKLKSHEANVHGKWSHQCPQCHKRFQTAKSLSDHQPTHSGERPYQCPNCPLRFPTLHRVRSHFPTHYKVRSELLAAWQDYKESPQAEPWYGQAPPTSDPEAPRDGDQNSDPMEQEEEDKQNMSGPGLATFQWRNPNIQLDIPMEEDNQDGPGPATLAKRRLLNVQMAAAQDELEEMEEMEEMKEDAEEGAHGAGEFAAPEERASCCSRPLQARFNVPNRECGGKDKCRIAQNSDYMELIKPSSKGKDFCLECFAVAVRGIHKERYMKKRNEHDKFEDVLRCKDCQKLWHRCCSFHLGRSNEFKCEKCMQKAGMKKVTKVLDAEKGRSRIVTMMEERLNAILKEEDGRISVRAVVGIEPKRVPLKSLAPSHYIKSFKRKYGQEVSYKNRTIAVFQNQNGVDQLFFMLFVHEYKNPAEKESWFVFDYLDSVKYLEAENRKQINQEILLAYFDFAKSLGILRGYIWADPPLKGDDFIFNIHPENQRYLDIDGLVKWYRDIFDEGVQKNRIVKYEDLRESKIEKVEDLPLFADSLWSKKMKDVEQRWKNSKKDFDEDMTWHMTVQHPKDNFFIELADGSELEEDDTPTTSQEWILDSWNFLEHCRNHNWEFGEPARARFSSVAIIEKLDKVLFSLEYRVIVLHISSSIIFCSNYSPSSMLLQNLPDSISTFLTTKKSI
ncbi:hypothetical protein B9Z55_008134 [Caenorhabditis nigoni]|uniref:histone acetyltransferase n=2 Tax=Caenorhabditis nigoni TaxID=1611254 RepID=A0A2G5VCR8_9PELO|nr:hypothetical protein B9Z55_008134 [Caenorhabditis nigoni]